MHRLYAGLALALLLVGTSLALVACSGQASALTLVGQSVQGAAQAGAPPVSPLIYGTNMALFDGNDPVVTSMQTQAGLAALGVKLIRLPARKSLSQATIMAAAQAVKTIGATPLVILEGSTRQATALADDQKVIATMNTVFGTSPVYYEYSNEDDLAGVTAAKYLAAWNTDVPQLKSAAPNGRFVGPVNFHFDQQYLTTFLQGANPRPDAVSWHEYTCDHNQAASICLSNIDHWTAHVSNAQQSIKASSGGSDLPIMITEWNFAPNAVAGDALSQDQQFVSNWTAKALSTLVASQVFASAQYTAAGGLNPLLDKNNQPTAEGIAFQRAVKMQRAGVPVQQTPTASGVTQQMPTGAAPTPTGVGAASGLATPTATGAAGASVSTNPIGAVAGGVAAGATGTGGQTGGDSGKPASQQQPTNGTAGQPAAAFANMDGPTWGPAWSADAINSQVFSTKLRAGQITETGAGGIYTALTGPIMSNVTVQASAQLRQFGGANWGVVARASDRDNLYKLYLDGSQLVLQKRVAGTPTTLVSQPFSAQDGASYTLRLQMSGTQITGSAWPSAGGGQPPVTPQISTQDSSLLSGQAGIRAMTVPTTTVMVTAFSAVSN